METAGVIARSAPVISEGVWPGYWPADQPFILYHAEEELVLLVADGTPPTDFVPVRDPDLPSELDGRTYLSPIVFPSCFGTIWQWGRA